MRRALALLVVVGGFASAGCVADTLAFEDARSALREATVTLMPGCAGVVVGDDRHAITAAHCIDDPSQPLEIVLHDGTSATGTLLVFEEGRDVAIIELDRAAGVKPLSIAPAPPSAGDPILFAGSNFHSGVTQLAEIERLGRCPSLPEVPDALFTTLVGEKGDSGSPVVDTELRVVGLVHGGAACSIATPVAAFAPVLDELLAAPN